MKRQLQRYFLLCLAVAGLLCSFAVPTLAVQPISGIQAAYDNITNASNNYSTVGGGSGNFPNTTTYAIGFNQGSQNNLVINGFEVGAHTYSFIQLAQQINLERVDNANITGRHHIVLYEELSVAGTNVDLKASYANTMETTLLSSSVNRGADNVFANAGDGNGNNNNIERIDYIFADGYPVYSDIEKRGFLVMDRGGNDQFKIAAITAVDTNGLPAAFNDPVSVQVSDWGWSGITIDTTVMRGYTEDGDVQHPSANVGVQNLDGIFVSWQELGLQTNDIIYGYALAGNDVTTVGANWTNVSNSSYFPTDTDTGSAYGGLDLMSGGAMFFDEILDSSIGDRVWEDWDGDGIQDSGEPGISNVLVHVYDSNTNLAVIARTDANGNYLASGMGPGDFFVKFFLPSTNYVFSPSSAGGDAALDSNADTATGETDLITLTSGTENLTVDAGMHLMSADLRVLKDVDDTNPNTADTIVYTVTVTNVSHYSVELVQVSDLLPTAVSYGSHLASQGTYTQTNGIWDIGTLGPGASASLSMTGTIATGFGGQTITNTASISRMNRPDTNTADNVDTAVLLVQAADLAVTKDVDQEDLVEGQTAVFTVSLANNGPDDATGIEVSDLLPAGLVFSNAIPSQGVYNDLTGIWIVGGLTNGASAILAISAYADSGTGGTSITNSADVSTSSHEDPVPENNSDSAVVNVQGADLGVRKAVNKAATFEGDTLVYTIAISNAGPAMATGVQVTEPLAPGLVYVGDSASQGSYDSGSGIWSVGALMFDATATLQLEVTVDTGTMDSIITNTAIITASDLPDPNPSNDTDSATIAVTSLQISKASDVAISVEPGGIINYTVVVSNAGSVAHANVSVVDGVPDGTSYIADSVEINQIPAAGPGVTTSIVYTSSSTFVVPGGVTNVSVEAWGGGGGGGGETGRRSTGGGGAGGAYAILANYAVTSLGNYTVTVGAGGGGGAAGINGSPGGASWFDAVGVVYAEGGGGGSGMTSNNGNGAGATGSSASSIGDTVYRGGNGAQGNTGASGAGGGGAGSTGAGGDASVGTGGTGTSLYGGNGANGVGDGTAGATGFSFGGGGSGGNASNNDDQNGGAGAGGAVIVSYALPVLGVGETDDPPNLAAGWDLDPGQRLEITFAVVVDDPLAFMSITNTATATSDLIVDPVSATVVDRVIPVDLAVSKTASIREVDEGDAVSFFISITNLSDVVQATGVAVTDVLPVGFVFDSLSASQGTYSNISGVWNVGALNPLAGATLTIVADAAVSAGGSWWTNVASISALEQTDTNLVNNTDDAVVLVRGADLALTKTVDNPAPNEDTEVTYTITVENLGPSDTTGVAVSEPLTNGITYVSHSASQGSYNTNSGIWTVGALGTGDVVTLDITVQVDSGTIGMTITNISQITGNDLPDPNATNDQDTAVISVSGLRVTKVSDVVDFAYPSSNITYTIVVTNLGATAHTGITVSDAVPVGTTYVPGSLEVTGPNWVIGTVRDEFNAQAYTNNDGTMDWNDDWQENDPAGTPGPVGDYAGVTAGGQLFMHWAYVGDERIWRSADLSGYDGAVLRYDWQTVNLDGSQTVSVLVSTNGADPFVEVGTYNGTSSGSEEIDITAFMSPSTTVRFENLSVNWDSGDYGYLDNVEMAAMSLTTNTVYGGSPPILATNRSLQSGEALTITYSVTVDAFATVTQIVNTVEVDSDQLIVPVTDTVEDPVPYTDLGVTKIVDDSTPNETDTVVWTVIVTNTGPADTTGVVLADLLPSGVTYVADNPSAGSYVSGSGVWTVGNLSVGASETLTITAIVDPGTAGSTITNTATITGNDLSDPNPANDHDDAIIEVIAVDIGVGKSVNPAVPFEKEQVVYTVSVTNFGPDTATGVVIEDLLPSGLTYFSHSASVGTYVSSSGVWSVGTLALSQTETLTLTANVQVGTAGQMVTNTATVTHVDQVDTTPANDTASAIVIPEQPPLDIFKSSNVSGEASPGDTITYTILVTNQSSQVQDNVTVTDRLPPTVSYVSSSALVYHPVTTEKTFLDQFKSRLYSNNYGTENWSGNWIETGDDGDPKAGLIDVVFDTTRGSDFTLRFRGGNRSVGREANLGDYANAVLSFDYRREGLNAGEFVAVEVSADGLGGAFTELCRFEGAATDASYLTTNLNITAWISTNTAIRYISTVGTMDINDIVWFDDVQITVPARTYETSAGTPPPVMASGYTLEPGEYLSITFDVDVDSEPTVTALTNIAHVISTQMTQTNTASVVDDVDIQYASLGGVVWFDGDADGLQDLVETNRIAMLPVYLLRVVGGVTNEVTNTVTGADGQYNFESLWPGDYLVRWDLTTMTGSNVKVTSPRQGGDDSLDSDGEFFSVTNGVGGLVDSRLVSLTAGVTNLNVDLGLTYLSPTRAELSTLWAEWREDRGYVVWRTSSEWNTAGFFLYAVDPETGAETRINEQLVVSAFNEAGARYEVIDPLAGYGRRATYRLEEVELSGQTRDLGTHPVTFKAPEKAFLKQMKTQFAVQSVETEAVPAVSAPSGRLTVRFREPGVYGVSFDAIAGGMGLSVDSVSATAQHYGFILSRYGQASVPYIVDVPGKRILFYGVATDNWYTREAAYQLTVGDGKIMTRREPQATEGRAIFPVSIHFEQDVYPRDTAPVRPDDYFYWKYVISGHPSLGSQSFALDLTGYAGGTLSLTVRLVGGSRTDYNPDHNIRFSLNGVAIGAAAVDGLDTIDVELDVPPSVVVDGINNLIISGVLPPGQTHSFFYVDEIKARFDRELRPEAGMLHAVATTESAVAVSGFTRAIALSLVESTNPIWLANSAGQLDPVAWGVETETEPFVLVDADRIPMLEPEIALDETWLLDKQNRIDYLIITSRALEPTAEALATYRREQGLRVGVTTYEGISDVFACGLRSPEVIRWFLAYASKQWKVSPWMVLLAGNGHYDYPGTFPFGNNHVPPLLHATPSGLFAADSLFADLTNDGLPDFAIGRLPARTSAELMAMIDKIQAYEATFGEVWQNTVVLAADASDAAGNFTVDSEKLASQMAAEDIVDRLYLDQMSASTAKSSLLSEIGEGVGFVHYTGHGGRDNLSQILRGSDVASLDNSRYPVLIALSCLSSRFEALGVDSLGAILMRKEAGGTVAVLGPSGLSYNEPATALGEAFHAQLQEAKVGTLGLAFMRARHAAADDGLGESTRGMYNLLGDPALRVGGYAGFDRDAETFAQWRWNLLSPSELVEWNEQNPFESPVAVALFRRYAFGGHPNDDAQARGIEILAGSKEEGLAIRWQRRRLAKDLDYYLRVSSSLVPWQDAPADVETVSCGIMPDGEMEQMETRIRDPHADQLFIRVDVVPK